MSKDQYYIWLSSADKTRQSSAHHQYITTLPHPLWLKGEWEVALIDFTYQGVFHEEPTFITVCCDLVESNIIGGTEAQVLRRLLPGSGSLIEYQFQQLQYMRIISSYITQIRLSFVDEKNKPIDFHGSIYCTLSVRKRSSFLS